MKSSTRWSSKRSTNSPSRLPVVLTHQIYLALLSNPAEALATASGWFCQETKILQIEEMLCWHGYEKPPLRVFPWRGPTCRLAEWTFLWRSDTVSQKRQRFSVNPINIPIPTYARAGHTGAVMPWNSWNNEHVMVWSNGPYTWYYVGSLVLSSKTFCEIIIVSYRQYLHVMGFPTGEFSVSKQQTKCYVETWHIFLTQQRQQKHFSGYMDYELYRVHPTILKGVLNRKNSSFLRGTGGNRLRFALQ